MTDSRGIQYIYISIFFASASIIFKFFTNIHIFNFLVLCFLFLSNKNHWHNLKLIKICNKNS